jgi:hypothetical protein
LIKVTSSGNFALKLKYFLECIGYCTRTV